MIRSELLKQAAECEARASRLSTLADKLEKAHDLLEEARDELASLCDASVINDMRAARSRTWSVVCELKAEVDTIRAEQARLIEEAGRVA